MDRDHNAAINIPNRGISTIGHVGTSLLDNVNAWGDWTAGLGVAYALNLSPVYELRIPASSVRGVSNLW